MRFRPINKKAVTKYAFILTISIFFYTCSSNNSFKPDISAIELDLEIQRFEKALFSIDTTQYVQEFEQLKKDFPDFMEAYVEQVMGFGALTNNAYQNLLLKFITNKDIQQLYDSTLHHFPDIKEAEQELNTAFRYFKHYFPNQPIPKVVSHISAFGPAAITYDKNLLGINLDMYLGKDFPFYYSANLPKYMVRRFEPEFLASNSMKAYAKALFEQNQKPNRLIDQMIYEGKLLYFLDMVLPDTPDSLKIGFSQEEINWCQQEEVMIWGFLIENELLYNSKQKEIIPYIEEAPKSKGMAEGSPGRAAVWMGWQIVKAYKKNHPDATFEDIMALNDGQKFLKKARYKPARR